MAFEAPHILRWIDEELRENIITSSSKTLDVILIQPANFTQCFIVSIR